MKLNLFSCQDDLRLAVFPVKVPGEKVLAEQFHGVVWEHYATIHEEGYSILIRLGFDLNKLFQDIKTYGFHVMKIDKIQL